MDNGYACSHRGCRSTRPRKTLDGRRYSRYSLGIHGMVRVVRAMLRWHRFVAPLAVVGLLLAFSSGRAGATQRILFYDPDANHLAILNVTRWFNAYLDRQQAGFKFQPVKREADFEQAARTPEIRFAIVTSEYLRHGGKLKLKPLLIPAAGGDTSYYKVLLDRGGGKLGSLAGKTVAVTVASEDPAVTQQRLNEVLQHSGIDSRGALVIPVSKDIDAVLALVYGQVQAALATPKSLEVLDRISPGASKTLHTLYKTRPLLRAPFCVVGKVTAEELQRATALIKGMAADPSGRKAMQTLGIDEWLPYGQATGGR